MAITGWDQSGHEAELKRQATELGVSDSVVFPGPQFNEAKADCLRRANAFILPSFSEGLPVSVLEAWSYSLPVLMTPECNLPEGFEAGAAIRTEVTARGVESGLRQLFRMTDADLRTMGERGRRLVEDRFTWARIAGEMISVYSWLLGESGIPACVQRTP